MISVEGGEIVRDAYLIRSRRNSAEGTMLSTGQFDNMPRYRLTAARGYLLKVMSWMRTEEDIRRMMSIIDGVGGQQELSPQKNSELN